MTNEYCARCGKRLADNPGGLRKYCPDCAKARRRQSWREYQRRRRSGDPVPKAVCERCGVEYKKTCNRQMYCEDCRYFVERMQNREAARRHSAQKLMEVQHDDQEPRSSGRPDCRL